MLTRFACVLALGLAGCAPLALDNPSEAGASASDAAEGATRPRLPAPLSKLSLAGGDVTVDPPEGYCIDPTTRQPRFALIASCQILTGGRAGTSVAPMIATVTVGPVADGLPDPATLAEASEAVLLTEGRAANLVTAQLATGGQAGLPNGDERYWRGVFLHAGRSIGLAVYGPKGSAIAGSEGASMLERIRDGIVAASPDEDAEATLDLPGALGRLFGR